MIAYFLRELTRFRTPFVSILLSSRNESCLTHTLCLILQLILHICPLDTSFIYNV